MDSWHVETFTWCKSSHSSDQANCVEVAAGRVDVGVRDSKAPGSGHLGLDAASWREFRRAL